MEGENDGWRERRSGVLPVVIVDRILAAKHLAKPAVAARSGDDQNLSRVRVFACFHVDECRQGEVAHRLGARVDDLMRDFRSAGRTRDDVVLANGVALVAEPQLAFAFEDQEHFLFAVMAVKGTLNLAGWQYGEVVAELFRSDQVADRAS